MNTQMVALKAKVSLESKWWLVAILVIAAALRLYRLEDMAHYNSDQAFAAKFVWSVVKEFPVQLIGQGMSLQGLFMGPWYFYFLVPFFLLTNLHPLGGYVGSIVVGLATIMVFYLVTKSFFNAKSGLILAFIWAVSFSAITTDWQMTPAYSSKLLILPTWWLLYQYWQGKTKSLPSLAFIFGLFTSFHPIHFPFYLVFLALFLIKRFIPSFKTLVLSLGAFILPISPLILFEYFRRGAMIKQILNLVSTSTGGVSNWSRLPYFIALVPKYVTETLGLSFLPAMLTTFIFLILVGYLLFKLLIKKQNNFHLVALPLILIIFWIYYAFFPGNVSEYYYDALFILAIFYTAAFLGKISETRLGAIVTGIILINITLTNLGLLNLAWTNQKRMNLANKDAIVKEIVKYQKLHPTEAFYVSYISELGSDFGYDYLFKLYGYVPTGLAVEPVYTIVTPKRLSENSVDFTSGDLGLILPEKY